jgi:tripartite-type tricarboxylate transporter receptor subunit TctC
MLSILTKALAMGLGGAALIAASLTTALAQTPPWPNRTVRFFIPFGAGAGADIGARLIAERLQKKWGQSIVIENKPGGDGIVAIQAFVGANDDHVLLYAATGSFTVHPYQREKLPYDRERDILPIARVANTLLGVAVPVSFGVNSLKELVEKARMEPGKLNVALVPGITEFVWDGFTNTEKLDIVKVPYRDIVQAVPDLGEGRIQIMMASVAILQPGINSGRTKMLALNGRTRNEKLAPGILTAIELGFKSLELEGLTGLLGPKTMSLDLRKKIGADVVDVAKEPEIANRLLATFQAVNPGGPEEFGKAMQDQSEQIAAIAKALKIEKKAQ